MDNIESKYLYRAGPLGHGIRRKDPKIIDIADSSVKMTDKFGEISSENIDFFLLDSAPVSFQKLSFKFPVPHSLKGIQVCLSNEISQPKVIELVLKLSDSDTIQMLISFSQLQYKMGWFQIPIEKDNIIAIGFIAKESWSSSDDWTAFHSIRVFRSDTEALPFQKAEKIRQKRRLQSVIGASRCLLPADSRIIPISEFKLSEISGVFPEVHVWDKAAIRDIFRKNLYFNFCSLSIPFSHPFDIEYICLELFCHSSAPPPEEL
ncbi:hypothetical protein ADUPG1_007336, partial [Aduncisulcus paluster]